MHTLEHNAHIIGILRSCTHFAQCGQLKRGGGCARCLSTILHSTGAVFGASPQLQVPFLAIVSIEATCLILKTIILVKIENRVNRKGDQMFNK